MRKTLFLLFAIFVCVASKAQIDKDSLKNLWKSTVISISDAREKALRNYADSVNNWERGNFLPHFLSDECLDNQVGLWPNLHEPISVRWKIISLVSNTDALDALCKAYGQTLKKKCLSPPSKVPFNKLSFFELMQRRKKQLKPSAAAR